ncbi:MAG TPA: hypothetical protein VK400_03525 [Pyrinomonadaceae bacterium]|nr:hypothetical protein [Pyrinomonadaceae bacterium]
MKAITCPQCGGLIQEINENRTIAECEYCDAKILVPFEKKPPVSAPNAAANARSGFNGFGYPIDAEIPYTIAALAEDDDWRGKLMTFVSAILIIGSAVGIFVAVSSKARSQANQAAQPPQYRKPTPKPTPNRDGVDKNIQSRAVSLPPPVLPKGTVIVSRVSVEVFIKVDEKGNVVEAQAYTGTEVLKEAAEQAARQAKFKPAAAAAGKESSGILFYEFSPS